MDALISAGTTAARRLLEFVASQEEVSQGDAAAAVRADASAALVTLLLDTVQISPEARRLSAS